MPLAQVSFSTVTIAQSQTHIGVYAKLQTQWPMLNANSSGDSVMETFSNRHNLIYISYSRIGDSHQKAQCPFGSESLGSPSSISEPNVLGLFVFDSEYPFRSGQVLRSSPLQRRLFLWTSRFQLLVGLEIKSMTCSKNNELSKAGNISFSDVDVDAGQA